MESDSANVGNTSVSTSNHFAIDPKDTFAFVDSSATVFRMGDCRDFFAGPSFVGKLKDWSKYYMINDDGSNFERYSAIWGKLGWDSKEVAISRLYEKYC